MANYLPHKQPVDRAEEKKTTTGTVLARRGSVVILARRGATRLEHPLEISRRNETKVVRMSDGDLLMLMKRIPTSVISNFTLPAASLSAMARYEVKVGCPTMEDRVSRCWCVNHSLKNPSLSQELQYTRWRMER
jgi:hypothetical protein